MPSIVSKGALKRTFAVLALFIFLALALVKVHLYQTTGSLNRQQDVIMKAGYTTCVHIGARKGIVSRDQHQRCVVRMEYGCFEMGYLQSAFVSSSFFLCSN